MAGRWPGDGRAVAGCLSGNCVRHKSAPVASRMFIINMGKPAFSCDSWEYLRFSDCPQLRWAILGYSRLCPHICSCSTPDDHCRRLL
eukprot:7261877-Lingulodinium_polyedra.AAC.1